MSYQFDFLWLGEYWPQIAKGIAITSQLTLVGGVIGVSLGTACAWARALGPSWLRPIVGGYVELIRNTPFLIQLFYLFRPAVAWFQAFGADRRQSGDDRQSRRL